MLTPDEGSAAAAARSPGPHATWHSPVPYLFGGLAAMLGLIACAVLILICSYWRLSGPLGGGGAEAERDLEAADDGGKAAAAAPVFEEKFLVILAGQEKPTCLATPMSSRVSSFGSNNSCSSSSTESCESSTLYKSEGKNEEGNHDGINGGDQVEAETVVHHLTVDQVSRS